MLLHRNLLIYDKYSTKLGRFYDNLTIILRRFANLAPDRNLYAYW